ncbi:MAG TPA: efflux RND transporter periplasmic adaptor subunit [Pirellulales bacterium]|jgi:cobalt-zinc-cadmium efflux system membrane fusion protein|nr:efflux RND transporter periplasmic adaptor subunit [Pirellulales bacterium]
MNPLASKSSKAKWPLIIAGVVIVVAAVVVPRMLHGLREKEADASSLSSDAASKVELVKGETDTLDVPADVVKTLGLKMADVQPDTTPRQLKLDGTLFVDPSHLARVHTRFAGEVVELGPAEPNTAEGSPARLRFGDRVEKDQLLAVVWSKDLGEKKSELVDAILHRRLDDETLKRLQAAAERGATSEQKLRDAQHNVEADTIAETRAERTLRSWRMSDEEIERIRKEADDLHEHKKSLDPKAESNWSRVEVLAPVAGVLVEVNVGPGDIVDTTLDLFKIADLSRLRVQCQVYEEDLPLLQELTDQERKWTVQLGNDRDARTLEGRFDHFDQIGHIIDPNTHTAQVMGWVENPGERLLIGQFVTAIVSLPPPKNLVAVPVGAVIENGSGASVFVKTPESPTASGSYRVQRRRVALVRQGDETVGVLASPSHQQRQQGIRSLEPHEFVVTSGALQLAAEMEEQQTSK